MEQILLRAAAKLNFSLDICGTRADGYHLLDMVMQTVSLFDGIALKKADAISLEADSGCPADSSNLAWKAAAAFFAETGESGGVAIRIAKRIPSQAGMAGGSADAAAVLIGLDRLYGTRLSIATLCRIGLPVGADLPYCLVGGTARVEGIGERITPVPQLRKGAFVILKPPTGISTPAAFHRFDQVGARRRPDNCALLQAMMTGRLTALSPSMENVLEQSAASPEVAVARRLLLQNGALAARMTGSGSAVFGVYEKPDEAKAVADRLKKAGHQSFFALPIGHCVEIIALV